MTDLKTIQTNLGITFNDEKLLKIALTHRSFLNEDKSAKVSNERLEFLGDSVLSVIVSTELYHRFTPYPEGKLTYLRSLLVKTKTLGELAKSLNLGSYMFISKGEEKSGGRENLSLLADTFEAFLGALYLDNGLDAARKFLETHLFPLIESVQDISLVTDFKSALQEKTQDQAKTSPTYKVLSETGPDHDKIFTVGVFLNDELLSEGSGKSKQDAEQSAASLALEKLGNIR